MGIVQIQAHSLRSVGVCPHCQQPSSSIHSHYTRYPQDLPSIQQRVYLELRVHRFHCRNPACPHQTFVERLPDLVPFYARRTQRLSSIFRLVGLEVAGRSRRRIGHHFGVKVSGDTLLRVLRQTPRLQYPEPRAVGIDDWAFKKGLRYGTILVDLERHCPIDLLLDRQAGTVTQWLKRHPVSKSSRVTARRSTRKPSRSRIASTY